MPVLTPPFRYVAGSGASVIMALAPAAWFRYGMGITVTGAGVSQWNDQSGNGRHLKQGTDANRPALQSDGSILFDGTAFYLKCDAFTLVQPETVYILGKQITWTANDRWADGNTLNTAGILQRTGTPLVGLIAGAAFGNISLALDTYGVVAAVFNGASSAIQLNQGAAVTGDVGAGDMGGFTLGATGAPGNYGNIQVKEAIIFPAAHDAATRTRVVSYLGKVGQLSL